MELITRQGFEKPIIGTPQSAGIDLYSAITVVIQAGKIMKIPLGVKVDFRCDLHPRSSLALKYGLMGQVGIIDEDYRGEVCLVVYNTKNKDVVVYKGDKVAQIIPFKKYVDFQNVNSQCKPKEIKIVQDDSVYEMWAELKPTERGSGGFGSTDIS